jgi:ribose 5-phosphate isomerase A
MAEHVTDLGKQAAGRAAAALVEPDMVIGLGTGSTVACFLDALAARGIPVTGLPTSEATAARARELGFRVLDPAQVARLDLAVDGADELDGALNLVKGGGGALLREKVVAWLADRFVVIATPEKQVTRLADSFPLPIEVVPFAMTPVTRWVEAMGFEVELRADGDLPTDNGNQILDCRMPGGIADPYAADQEVGRLPGVVSTGLFLGLADVALIGDVRGEVTEMLPHV